MLSDSHRDIPSFDVLGARVSPLTVEGLTELVFEPPAEGIARVFAHVNLHGLFLFKESDVMRRLLAGAQLVHADGMPVIWIGRFLGYPLSPSHRVTYVDWLPRILREAEDRSARIYFLGGSPGVGERASDIIRTRYPRVRFDHHHGYLNSREDHARVVKDVKLKEPDVLFVGMGMPRQEEWILDNLDELPPCTVLPCGACFDYFTGRVPTPPRVLGRLGLEWAFRLAVEPRRLWRRYMVEPVALLPRILLAKQQQRR